MRDSLKGDPYAVSYTHLDVYKRQVELNTDSGLRVVVVQIPVGVHSPSSNS